MSNKTPSKFLVTHEDWFSSPRHDYFAHRYEVQKTLEHWVATGKISTEYLNYSSANRIVQEYKDWSPQE